MVHSCPYYEEYAICVCWTNELRQIVSVRFFQPVESHSQSAFIDASSPRWLAKQLCWTHSSPKVRTERLSDHENRSQSWQALQ